MKKSLCMLLSLLLVLSTLLIACDDQATPPAPNTETTQPATESTSSNKPNKPSEPSTPTIPTTPPEGYSFYTIGDLRFVYPDTWVLESVEGEDALKDNATGNNIVVSSDSFAELYSTITAEEHQVSFSQMFEDDYGWNVFGETAEIKENPFGLNVNVISYFITAENRNFKQVVFSTSMNDESYAIILTLVEGNTDLEEAIFNSIVNVNPKEPAAPSTHTNYNLRLSLPANWTKDTTDGLSFEHGISSLDWEVMNKTTKYDNLTIDQFNSELKPILEERLGGAVSNVSIHHEMNQNGLAVTKISFIANIINLPTQMTLYAVTVDETTHQITLMQFRPNEAFCETLLDSLTAVSGPNYSNS